ncbi:MAG: TerB family tellurite resistance protein [Bacteroidetes bacterium]|nr:TerB family tellurite resistance protein [Bacteroidota bacterium]
MENKDEAKSLLCELIQLAKADETISQAEFQFLMSMAGHLGLNQSDLESIIENPVEFDPPTSEGDRIIQFHRMVLLMNIDLSSTEEERQFLINSAIRMGLSPTATRAILNKMNEYPNKIVPPDVLISIFKTHYN